MHIAIIGTRGIPNHYGGFEQCAEYLAVGLVQRGFDVTVYNSHNHPFKENIWKGVKIVHCYDPEFTLGTAGQFIYDFNCIINTRGQKYDIIVQMGYTSSSVWGWLLPSRSVVTTNMDGLEWNRTKYSNLIKRFLVYAEKLGVKFSDYLISDSIGIQEYLYSKYKKESIYIPYGANLFDNADEEVLKQFSVVPYKYNMLIARLEPENSIEIILDGVVKSETTDSFLIIGNHTTKYGTYLKEKYSSNHNLRFTGSIYNINILNNLRHYSNIYFHGHTVGGTNPSLLEGMASNALICANENPFNKYILDKDAFYFLTSDDIVNVIKEDPRSKINASVLIENNRNKIKTLYSWDLIIDKYSNHFKNIKKS